jgi:omega-6 fatty acid desaturase (delta-12 desaturase)
MQFTEQQIKKDLKNWSKIIAPYRKADRKKAWWQVVNTFVPFLALWTLMYFSVKWDWSYWATLGLAVLNGFFLVRIFIIQHDCGHQSFLSKKGWNNTIGFLCSFFSTIPYRYWAQNHAVHHAHNGQLDHKWRDIGDIYTMTVKEYREASWFKKILYRLFRNPLVMFVLGPIWYMLVPIRIPKIKLEGWAKWRISQVVNNLILVSAYIGLGYLLGWKEFFMVQIPIVMVFAIVAIWFFYVQHQHEETYKEWKGKWDFLVASIRGSTFYKLPRPIQWLTGNIGFHHIHHLNSTIPNYNLEKCATENPILNKYVNTITFKESLKCMWSHLWDEENQRMISFWKFHKMERTKLAMG